MRDLNSILSETRKFNLNKKINSLYTCMYLCILHNSWPAYAKPAANKCDEPRMWEIRVRGAVVFRDAAPRPPYILQFYLIFCSFTSSLMPNLISRSPINPNLWAEIRWGGGGRGGEHILLQEIIQRYKKLYHMQYWSTNDVLTLTTYSLTASPTLLYHFLTGRVSNPVWYWPDPDSTSQDKSDPDPDTSVLKIFHLFYDKF